MCIFCHCSPGTWDKRSQFSIAHPTDHLPLLISVTLWRNQRQLGLVTWCQRKGNKITNSRTASKKKKYDKWSHGRYHHFSALSLFTFFLFFLTFGGLKKKKKKRSQMEKVGIHSIWSVFIGSINIRWFLVSLRPNFVWLAMNNKKNLCKATPSVHPELQSFSRSSGGTRPLKKRKEK